MMRFKNSTSIKPAGRVSIKLISYSLLANKTYEFELLSSIPIKVVINSKLNVQTGNKYINIHNETTANITKCYLGSEQDPNPPTCNQGIQPIIQYDDTLKSFNLFI